MRPKEVVLAWVDAFNRADANALAAMYSADAINHQVAESPAEGRDAIRAMFSSGFQRAEMVCIPQNLFEDGDWAILEWRDPKGLMGSGFFHVRDGQIVFQRGYWDKLSFFKLHGLPPDPFLEARKGSFVKTATCDSDRQLLRHAVATLAYRGGKVVRGAPADFSSFSSSEGCRSAGQILAHIGDLLDWALSIAKGQPEWHNSQPQSWQDNVNRFHAALAAFDGYLASDQPLHASTEKLFQGPIADALTHVGQLAMMRRAAGAPIKGENYFVADIAAGRVGPDQPAPKREF